MTIGYVNINRLAKRIIGPEAGKPSLMIEEKIGCLPVVEDNLLVGLITATNVLVQEVEECDQR